MSSLINNFSFDDKTKTNTSIEYSPEFLVGLRMSTYLQNQDPRFFKLVRADDEHLYTGRFPLSESEAMPVDNVQIDDDAIIVNKKSVSEIVFHFYLQPEIKELIQIFI